MADELVVNRDGWIEPLPLLDQLHQRTQWSRRLAAAAIWDAASNSVQFHRGNRIGTGVCKPPPFGSLSTLPHVRAAYFCLTVNPLGEDEIWTPALSVSADWAERQFRVYLMDEAAGFSLIIRLLDVLFPPCLARQLLDLRKPPMWPAEFEKEADSQAKFRELWRIHTEPDYAPYKDGANISLGPSVDVAPSHSSRGRALVYNHPRVSGRVATKLLRLSPEDRAKLTQESVRAELETEYRAVDGRLPGRDTLDFAARELWKVARE